MLQIELDVDLFALLPGRQRHAVGHQLTFQLFFGEDGRVLQKLGHGADIQEIQTRDARGMLTAMRIELGRKAPILLRVEKETG